MNGFLAATGFLTRVPVDRRTMTGIDAAKGRDAAHDHDSTIAGAVPWFPVVGALVGALVAGVYWAAAWALPPIVAATLAIAAGVIATGAFHEDGLADTADAVWGGWTPERRLEILKDSRHGTYGVTTIVLATAMRVGALATLTPGRTALGALVAAHALGRGGAVGLMGTTANARSEGLASYTRLLRSSQVAAGIAAALVLGAAGLGGWVAPAALLTVVSSFAVRRLALRKLGGVVGDVLGATEQLAEIAVLLLAAAVVHRGGRSIGWWPT